jgi:uncharacterized protein YgiM (DUF1202 family)
MNHKPSAALLLLLPVLAISCSRAATPVTPAAQEVKPVAATSEPPKVVQPPPVIVQQQAPIVVRPAPPQVYYRQASPGSTGSGYYSAKADVLIRSGPGTSYGAVSSLKAGEFVLIDCQTQGENVRGPAGGSTLWDQTSVPNVGFVSDEFISTGTTGSNDQVAATC